MPIRRLAHGFATASSATLLTLQEASLSNVIKLPVAPISGSKARRTVIGAFARGAFSTGGGSSFSSTARRFFPVRASSSFSLNLADTLVGFLGAALLELPIKGALLFSPDDDSKAEADPPFFFDGLAADGAIEPGFGMFRAARIC
jgi:hypothetical protein